MGPCRRERQFPPSLQTSKFWTFDDHHLFCCICSSSGANLFILQRAKASSFFEFFFFAQVFRRCDQVASLSLCEAHTVVADTLRDPFFFCISISRCNRCPPLRVPFFQTTISPWLTTSLPPLNVPVIIAVLAGLIFSTPSFLVVYGSWFCPPSSP